MLEVVFKPQTSKFEAARQVVDAINRHFKADGVITVKLIDEAAIVKLNQRYSGKTQPTDVLSFNYQEGGGAAESELGDVVINQNQAARQAKTADSNLKTELALLSLHGILHILGFDHQTKTAQAKLDHLQQTIMADAGLAYRPFNWA